MERYRKDLKTAGLEYIDDRNESHTDSNSKVVALLGLEPRMTESKSAVLPITP